MAVKRQTLLVILLGLVGGGALYTTLRPAASAGPSPAGAPRSEGRAASGQAHGTAPEVHLESLKEERPSPTAAERNLFRFKPKPAPAPSSPVATYVPPPPPGPPPPPAVPPIGLRYIGLLESGGSTKIAILSDGRGAPIHGKEGEAVLGQYRILQISADSIEVAYLDGQGRQRIRLSGS
jgi:hypothetical protein